MSPRTDLLNRLVDRLGGTIVVEEAGRGWPALVSIGDEARERIPTALYISQIGVSHRGRDHVERRFQNPGGGLPMVPVPGHRSLLLGAWESDPHVGVEDPILVLADAERRIGRVTRFSVFIALATLREAQEGGWSTQHSETGEQILCFRPELLPLAAAVVASRVDPDERAIRTLRDSGVFDESHRSGADSSGDERVRRAVSTLVRDARFRGRVLDAYGRSCAMCGLGLSLVEGAHIYPASAPGSNDRVTNGLALCANHHRAFDRHQVGIVPENDCAIFFRGDIIDRANDDAAARQFVNGTARNLRRPADRLHRPDALMFERRYRHFESHYEWLVG